LYLLSVHQIHTRQIPIGYWICQEQLVWKTRSDTNMVQKPNTHSKLYFISYSFRYPVWL
jgi:hypothetical protein